MTKLTAEERDGASKALIAWFKSQDIDPQDGAIIMMDIMALCLVDKTTNSTDLANAAESFYQGLVMTIGLALVSKVSR